MKKLKVVLTLLFAMSFSLFLFSCGEPKTVNRIRLEGQKTTFSEGEAFSVGDLKVSVRYNGSDEYVELKASEYDVDSSAYDPSEAGDYVIIVTPKNQPEEQQVVTEEYYATVEHAWTEVSTGVYECSCGASRETYSNLTDVVTTGAWGGVATLTNANSSYATEPISGENHVSYGSLTQGQSMVMTLKITAVDTSATWNTPLMGIRSGSVGTLPREDNWVIGSAAGFDAPSGLGDVTATAGTATESSTEWQVYTSGTTWNAADLVDTTGADPVYGSVVVTFNYQLSDVFVIRHELYSPGNTSDTPDRTLTYTLRVPDGSYEIVAYGEKVTYNVSALVITRTSKVVEFTATNPDNLVQAEGKSFDTTGITTLATMNKNDKQTGKPLTVIDSYNAYAYIDVATEDGETESQRVSLTTNLLQAGMYDFCLEFAGFTYYYTTTGEAVGHSGEGNLISVVPSEFIELESTAIKYNGVLFDSPAATVDYTLNSAKDGIRIVVSGTPALLSAEQKAALNTTENYYVAFKILGAEATFDAVTASQGAAVIVNGEGGLKNVDVIVPVSASAGSYNLVLLSGETTVQTVTVDLSGVSIPEYTAEIAESEFTLDAGGSFTVKFAGFSGSSISDVGDYKLVVNNRPTAISTIVETINSEGEYKPSSGSSISVVGVSFANGALTVNYKLSAPALANISSSNAYATTSLYDASNNTLASATYYYDFKFSAEPAADSGIVKVAEDVYAFVSAKRLYIIKAFDDETTGGDIRSGLETIVQVNIQNDLGLPYNLSMTLNSDGTIKIQDSNSATTASNTSTKFVVVGSVDDNSDYDRGGLMVMEVALDAIGIRANDAKEIFYFEPYTGLDQDAYVIYRVNADDSVTAITLEPTGERIEKQAFSCVANGSRAYLYTDTENDIEFYYGTIVTYASGVHTFGAYDASNRAVCSVCGAVKTKVVVDDSSWYEYVLLSKSSANVVVNTDTSGVWWDSSALGSVTMSGDFAVQYTWTNTRDVQWYQDVVIELTDGSKIFYMNFFISSGAWGDLWTASDTATLTTTITKNGETVSAVTPEQGSADVFGGDYTVTIVRFGSTLTITQTLVATTGDTWVVTDVFAGFTTADLTAQLDGNPYWVDSITVTTSNLVYNYVVNGDSLNVTVGAISDAVKTGVSVSAAISGHSGDWGTQVIKTASNYIVTLPNLDPWNNTSEDGFLTNANAYPTADDLHNGGIWDSFLTADAIYMTVSVSVTDGVKFFKNGELLVWYKADRAIGTATVADFAERVLTEISTGGFTFMAASASGATATALQVGGAVSDLEALALYDAYVGA